LKTCPATTSSIATIPPILRPRVGRRERNLRIEKVAYRLFEGWEAVVHLIGWEGGRIGSPTYVTVCFPPDARSSA
jgi:hypothetical protein